MQCTGLSAPLLAVYPKPNGAVSAATYTGEFTGSYANSATLDATSPNEPIVEPHAEFLIEKSGYDHEIVGGTARWSRC